MKKHLSYPVQAEELPQFCHPFISIFSKPFIFQGNVTVSNGWLALQIQTAVDCDHQSDKAVERVSKLPWHYWPDFLDVSRTALWGNLDERRAGLWQRGHIPLFNSAHESQTQKLVIVGHPSNIMPVPVLQLISSLPRPHIYLDPLSARLIAFRFNGGFGFAHRLDLHTLPGRPSYHLWNPLKHPHRLPGFK